MEENLKYEIIGRLWLWQNSISRTQELLQLAFRARMGMHQEAQKVEMDNYIKKRDEFDRAQQGYKAEKIFKPKEIYFDKILQRTFTTYTECAGIYDACIELAIVYFSQIFNLGYRKYGEAASNNESFIKENFNKILATVFETNEELERFQQLKTKILTVRDKMIGHSDGDSYSFQYDHYLTVVKSARSWHDIDIEFWNSFLEKMRIEIHHYSNRIKLSDKSTRGTWQ